MLLVAWVPLRAQSAAIPGDPVSSALTGSHATYNVGPGQAYAELDTVPWRTLEAGDVVNIFHRATRYCAKFGIRGQGTPTAPIVINGVTDAAGNRPVLDFSGARTASGCYLDTPGANNIFSPTPAYGESLGGIVLKRGTTDPATYSPKWIQLRNLELRGAANGNSYVTHGGVVTPYDRASGLYILHSEDILLENLVICDNGQGIFTMAKNGVFSEACKRITIRGCRVFGNGVDGSDKQHNLYVQCHLPVVEGNFIGRVRPGSIGSSYKSRCSGELFRYNYVEASARAIDWVYSESQEIDGIVTQPEYGTDFAYGNVIVNDASTTPHASNPIHYGGDNVGEQVPRDASGNVMPVLVIPFFRSHLYFWNNTVVLRGAREQHWWQSVFDLSVPATTVEAWNNLFVIDPAGGTPPVTGWVKYAGRVNLLGNNLVYGPINDAAGTAAAAHYQVNRAGALLTAAPQFADLAANDFRLLAVSPAVNAGAAPLPAEVEAVAGAHPVAMTPHLATNGAEPRVLGDGVIDLGAFEYLAPPAAGYWAWIGTFTLAPGLDAPLADPDGDGVANLLEYALGLDPVVPAPAGISSLIVSDGGIDYPAIRYVRRTSATDVAVQVEVATDLGFGPLLSGAQVAVAPGAVAGTEVVTVRSSTPVSAGARQFFRLRCVLP